MLTGYITNLDLLIKRAYIDTKEDMKKWYYDGGIHEAPLMLNNEVRVPRGNGSKKRWQEYLATHRDNAKYKAIKRKKVPVSMTRIEATWAVREAEAAVKRFCPSMDFKIYFSLDNNSHAFLISPDRNKRLYHCIPIGAERYHDNELIIRTYRSKGELVVHVKTYNSAQNFYFDRNGLVSGPAPMGSELRSKTGRIKITDGTKYHKLLGSEIIPVGRT
jgi:hypothetical protein